MSLGDTGHHPIRVRRANPGPPAGVGVTQGTLVIHALGYIHGAVNIRLTVGSQPMRMQHNGKLAHSSTNPSVFPNRWTS